RCGLGPHSPVPQMQTYLDDLPTLTYTDSRKRPLQTGIAAGLDGLLAEPLQVERLRCKSNFTICAQFEQDGCIDFVGHRNPPSTVRILISTDIDPLLLATMKAISEVSSSLFLEALEFRDKVTSYDVSQNFREVLTLVIIELFVARFRCKNGTPARIINSSTFMLDNAGEYFLICTIVLVSNCDVTINGEVQPSEEWIGTAVIPCKAETSEVIRRLLNSANIRVAFQKWKMLRSVLVRLVRLKGLATSRRMSAKMDPSVRPDLFAFTFIMFWLVVFQGTCHHWEKYRLRLEEVIYDCRGYFSNIEKEHARKVVHERRSPDSHVLVPGCYKLVVEKSFLIPHLSDFVNNHLVSFRIMIHCVHCVLIGLLHDAYHEECKVEFSYHPYKDALLVHPQCSKAVNQILANLPELVWGSPWGCAAMNMSFELTDYYSVKVELPRLRLTYIHGEYDAQCESRILGITVNERISCRMNSFGGYEWENVNMSACSVPELNGADLERLHFLRASSTVDFRKLFLILIFRIVKPTCNSKLRIGNLNNGPMYCRLMIFMLYGYVKLQPVLLETHIHTVLDHIHYECAPFTPSDFEAVYNDFRNILDLVIHQLGNRPKPKLNDRFVIHAVTSLMRVFGRRLQDYFNTSTLFQQPTRVMYAFQTAAKNEIARVTTEQRSILSECELTLFADQPLMAEQLIVRTTRRECGWNYDIIIKRITGNVMVICLESIRALKDITAGGLAIFSGLVYTELLEPSPNMVLDIYFKLPIEFTSVDYICARYNPTAKTDGDLWDTRDSCFMKRRRGATIRCVCRHTGYYAILYPQKDFETVGVKFYGILRGHGMHLVHVVTSVLLLFGLSYLLAVRLYLAIHSSRARSPHEWQVPHLSSTNSFSSQSLYGSYASKILPSKIKQSKSLVHPEALSYIAAFKVRAVKSDNRFAVKVQKTPILTTEPELALTVQIMGSGFFICALNSTYFQPPTENQLWTLVDHVVVSYKSFRFAFINPAPETTLWIPREYRNPSSNNDEIQRNGAPNPHSLHPAPSKAIGESLVAS
ncbi:hypothetical protein CLF_102043, partial [Clonorchis sinensis]